MVNPPQSQEQKPFLLDQYNQFDFYESSWEGLGINLQKKISDFRLKAFGSYTEQSDDIDEYDLIYRHVYMLDRETGDLLSYYRMGLTQDIVPLGIERFYISSLYDVDPKFFEENPKSAEMGRFILNQESSQTQYLMPLLWKSLYLFAKKYDLDFYFGMVTLSSDFKKDSLKKMVGYMKRHAFDADKGRCFTPKYPFEISEEEVCAAPETVPKLQAAVKDLEGENGPQVPVMYRTYMSYGDAKYLTSGYDPDFDNSVDIIITGHPYTNIVKQIIKKFS